jgi:hypothetical protein
MAVVHVAELLAISERTTSYKISRAPPRFCAEVTAALPLAEERARIRPDRGRHAHPEPRPGANSTC